MTASTTQHEKFQNFIEKKNSEIITISKIIVSSDRRIIGLNTLTFYY